MTVRNHMKPHGCKCSHTKIMSKVKPVRNENPASQLCNQYNLLCARLQVLRAVNKKIANSIM